MKKLKKLFTNLLIIAYAAIAISVTILLLSYNDYHCSVVGGYTFILVTDDELEPDFNPGELVLVKQTKAKNINPGDEIFLYRRITNSQFEIKYAEVLVKDTSKGEYKASYVLEGGTVVDHEDVIGSTEDMIVVPYLGTILSILESRYGYLFLIVVVSFIAFLYEIYELIMEIKYGDREEDEEEYADEEYGEEYDDEYDEEEYAMPRRVAPRRKPVATVKKVAPTARKVAPSATAPRTRVARTAETKATAPKTTRTTRTATTTTAKAPVEKTATKPATKTPATKVASTKTTTAKTTTAKRTSAATKTAATKRVPAKKTTTTRKTTTKKEISE